MSELESALHAAIQEWDRVRPRNAQRAPFSAGFRAGWAARTANTNAVMVTREYLADLERRVAIREKRAFMPRPDGSVY